MALIGEWRTGDGGDVVLIVDDALPEVRQAMLADASRLHRLLTDPGDFGLWRGDLPLAQGQQNPAGWGQLVLARAQTGEVINMEPRLFWEGVYQWFRSRGVDYDTPGQ